MYVYTAEEDADFCIAIMFVLNRYWTDNGACYYYDTGNYSNYEEVLDAVIADADKADLPFRYLQVYNSTAVEALQKTALSNT